MSLHESIQKLVSLGTDSSTFDKVMRGLRVAHVDEGKVTLELEVKQEHLNIGGALHGGMISTLVDVASTCAVATLKGNWLGVSVDMSVSFMSAAFNGDKLAIKSEVLKGGKNLVFANVDIFKEDGTRVASGRQTQYMNAGGQLPAILSEKGVA